MLAILFTIFSVAFIAGDLSKTDPSFDNETYLNKINTFFDNEAASLKVLQSFNTDNADYLKNEVSKSIDMWQENKNIMVDISKMDNLPIDLSVQIKKLEKYSDLRIEHFGLILKSLNEDTDKYSNQIQNIGLKIEKIIKEME